MARARLLFNGMCRCELRRIGRDFRRYCGMGTHFSSFDAPEKHEFIRAMENFLTLAKKMTLMPKIQRRLSFGTMKKSASSGSFV